MTRKIKNKNRIFFNRTPKGVGTLFKNPYIFDLSLIRYTEFDCNIKNTRLWEIVITEKKLSRFIYSEFEDRHVVLYQT
jgi:hypothetical protein